MNTKASSCADNNGPRPSDRWIPWYFVLFFVVTCSVLGFFSYLAIHTDPGVVTNNAYQKGLDYDRIIAASDQSSALPWQANIILRQSAAVSVLEVTLKDNHQILEGATVEAWLMRPTKDGMDQHWQLKPAGNGTYLAEGQLPQGAWNIHVTVMLNGRQKQFIKPIVVS
ncbi:MAG: hypothetical protein EYC62_08960 [Alphaproteobacteria bacterium]|nr:MAG: hypothetical protein EYC62_08960 [Alphaproteobacteria bacterium]